MKYPTTFTTFPVAIAHRAFRQRLDEGKIYSVMNESEEHKISSYPSVRSVGHHVAFVRILMPVLTSQRLLVISLVVTLRVMNP